MSAKCSEKTIKQFEKHWLVMLKYYLELLPLLRYCVEPIQTNPHSQYWNDNELASNTIGFKPQ